MKRCVSFLISFHFGLYFVSTCTYIVILQILANKLFNNARAREKMPASETKTMKLYYQERCIIYLCKLYLSYTKLKWVGRAVSKGQSGSSRRRRGITVLGDENEEGTVVSAHSHFGKLKSKFEKGELDGDEVKHRFEGRSFPNESEYLISSLHLRLLSSTGVSVGVSLQIERSQLPIERSQLRNLNPLPFDSGPVRKLLSSPNPRRIVPILARYGLQLLDEMDRF
ncbi:unnamed protein product [Brassica rapa subsp. narinosa]|uniref:(rape) hypothetical protein n=1 Tax=Brassica napus TaxID=3708 RepID=A0A816SFS9_BRANA|nr:unnamed protein product [Brassica napus]